jgi:hypothetical protein
MIRKPLQRIEAYLEGILERSPLNFPRQAPTSARILSDLLLALEEHAEEGPAGQYWIAPNALTVSLSRQSIDTLKEESGVKQLMENELLTYIQQREMVLLGSLTLTFHADGNIPLRAIRIHAEITGDADTTTAHPNCPAERLPVEIPPGAYLIIHGERHIPLIQPVIRIGRHSENLIVLDDSMVSRRHALLRARKGHFLLTDISSKHGTFVNAIPMNECVLTSGDVIRMGQTDLIYGDDSQETQTQPLHLELASMAFAPVPQVSA